MGRPLRAKYANATYVDGVQEMSNTDISSRIVPLVSQYLVDNYSNPASIGLGQTLIIQSGNPAWSSNVTSSGNLSDIKATTTGGAPVVIGDHPVVNTPSFGVTLWQNLNTADPFTEPPDLGANRPLQTVSSGGVRLIQSMTDTQIQNDIISNVVSTMVTGGLGAYWMGTSAPVDGGTWVVRSSVYDTYNGPSGEIITNYYLWQKTATGSSAGTIRPLKRSANNQLQEMSDTDIVNLASHIRKYTVSTGIGLYRISTSAPGEGTWISRGSFVDTRNVLTDDSYSGGKDVSFTRSFSRGFTRSFTGTYAGTYTGSFTGNYTTTFTGGYTGTYQGGYTGTYQGSYTATFSGAYTTTFLGAYTTTFLGSYTKTFTGNWTATFSGTYSKTFTGNWTGTYQGSYTGAYASSYQGSYSGTRFGSWTRTWTGSYTGSYTGTYQNTRFDSEQNTTFSGPVYTGVYEAVVPSTGSFDRAYTGLYAGSYIGFYAGSRDKAYNGFFNAPSAFTGAYNQSPPYTGLFNRSFAYIGLYNGPAPGNVYTGAYNRSFSYQGSFNRTFAYIGFFNRPVAFTGTYDRSIAFTGTYDRPIAFTGTYDRLTTYTGVYDQGFAGTRENSGNRLFTGDFNQAFSRFFTGAYSGLTVSATTVTTTYTLWVRTA